MKFLTLVGIYVALVMLGTILWQWAWTFTGMDVWTGLGPMPSWCSFFMMTCFAACRGGK